ncbi:hypothetical protein EVC29_111 [Rhizobium phage RHph_Y52]|nr:hypothetical protein EVC16_111 [Rhizobium phage RHph_Y21]QIG76812.1 hypothetical protein EVC29_111 [Rhizobium phage RHph_Y52]
MKYAGRDPHGRHIVGTLHRQWSNGITIEYENGVREFINTNRVIGPVVEEEKVVSNDLFGPVR